MKNLFFPLLAGAGLICFSRTDVCAQQQEFKQHISKEFSLQKSTGGVLALYNLNGSLDVEGYSGDKVLIEVDERLRADDSASLEIGKRNSSWRLTRSPTRSSSILRRPSIPDLVATVIVGNEEVAMVTGRRSPMTSTWSLRSRSLPYESRYFYGEQG